jgi:hypothetical protein
MELNLEWFFKQYLQSKGNIRSYKNLKLALESDLIYKQSLKLLK